MGHRVGVGGTPPTAATSKGDGSTVPPWHVAPTVCPSDGRTQPRARSGRWPLWQTSAGGQRGQLQPSFAGSLMPPWAHPPPQYLPVIEATSESEHAARQVAQLDVVALQDNITQGTALQGWRGACSEAREQAAGTNLQGTLQRRQQGPEWLSWPQSRPQARSRPCKGTATLGDRLGTAGARYQRDMLCHSAAGT